MDAGVALAQGHAGVFELEPVVEAHRKAIPRGPAHPGAYGGQGHLTRFAGETMDAAAAGVVDEDEELQFIPAPGQIECLQQAHRRGPQFGAEEITPVDVPRLPV